MVALLSTGLLRVQVGSGVGKVYDLYKALRIGRHPFNEISLADPHASRYHCWITGGDAGFFIEDLASSNGTYVNGRRVQLRHRLSAGDVVRVGRTEFLFTEEE